MFKSKQKSMYYVVKHGQGHDINEVICDNSFNTDFKIF